MILFAGKYTFFFGNTMFFSSQLFVFVDRTDFLWFVKEELCPLG